MDTEVAVKPEPIWLVEDEEASLENDEGQVVRDTSSTTTGLPEMKDSIHDGLLPALNTPNNKAPSSSLINTADLCRSNIGALAERKSTFCEREMFLLELKYKKEMELIQVKKETELLKQKLIKEKILYFQKNNK